MDGRRNFLIVVVTAAALALAACGDSNPASPSGTGGVSVTGVLLGEDAAFTASSAASSNGGPITVVVEGTSISATISGNGTWKLEDVPAGDFTLVFFQDGEEIGRIEITAEDGVEVDVLVKIVDSEIVLIKIDFDGEDDGDDDGDSIKVNVCHKGRKTLTIDASAENAHLGHGDTSGDCPEG
jgi:hypothetical protein